LPKETKYSISKAYGVSIDRLEKANPILQTEELKIGQKIIIPVKLYDPNAVVENVKKEDPDSVQGSLDQGIQHEVLAKETKYGIAREYGITVKELESQNPKITKGLLIGSILTIRGSRKEVETVAQQTVLEPVIEEKEAVTLGKDEDEDLLDKLVSTASDNIGVRYRSGGTTKNGFDCSGLMCATFGTYDIKLPRTSIEQSQYGYVVDNERAKKGDLIFFKTNGRSRINHVGMVIEVLEGEIKFIHAATHGGVTISSTKESYYAKRMAQINRVLN
jgi:cell wall-associated NlpC family hydrolase